MTDSDYYHFGEILDTEIEAGLVWEKAEAERITREHEIRERPHGNILKGTLIAGIFGSPRRLVTHSDIE